MQGLPGDDILIASSSDDDMNGGKGFDIVQYRDAEGDPAKAEDYFSVLGYDIIFGKRGKMTIVDTDPGLDGNTGTDSLSRVEWVVFSDGDASGGGESLLTIFNDGTNNPALAVQDSFIFRTDGTVISGPASLLDNDLEFDGDAIIVTAFGNTEMVQTGTPGVEFDLASTATVRVNADGTYVYDAKGTVLGTDSFWYTISDSIDGETTAKVSVIIQEVIDLTTLSEAEGFIIQGDMASDRAGISVSAAGDVNGDGFDDLIVGAPFGDDAGDDAGEAYVIFGTASTVGVTDGAGRQVLDLASLTAADGFIIQGDTNLDTAGYSVSAAGDVNGDGFDDLIVGAPFGDDGGDRAGEAYVIFGTDSGFGTTDGYGRRVIDLMTLSADEGFIIQGDMAEDVAGRSVSAAGDVNGDGFDDLIVGAYAGYDGGNMAGEAYVIFGTASTVGVTDGAGRRVIDLTALSAAEGFIIQGDTAGDFAGYSVSAAGDVNGDGFDDLIVGAFGGDDGGVRAGEAYVIFGTDSGFGLVLNLTTLSAADGFIIQGDMAGDVAGRSVSAAGDVNGDGFDDLIVGAYAGADGGGDAGEAYVIFGTDLVFGTTVNTGGYNRQVIDLTSLDNTEGFIIQGDMAGDRAGYSVSAAGDVNGDGFDDLIVGAYGGDDGGGDAGEAYVLFGADFLQVVDLTGTAGPDILIGGASSDTLDGMGGADVIRAGAGDDTIIVRDASFFRIDGGGGQDTLEIAFDFDLDLTALANDESNLALQSIETIDMFGGGGQTLTLKIDDLLDLSETPNAHLDPGAYSHNSLVVIGDSNDSVVLAASVVGEVGYFGGVGDWVDTTTTVEINAQNFLIFNYTDDGTTTGDVLGSIAIDPDIMII